MKIKKPPYLFYLTRKIARKIFNRVFDINIMGFENIPVDKQYILISNHLNWSDPFFIYSIFPPEPRIIFVAEYEGIYDTLFKKIFVDIHGKPIVTIKRNDAGSRIATLKSMFKVVKGGEILAVFPEGRLGHKEGELFPLHVGVFTVAKRLKVPVLPVAITGSKELFLKKPIHIKIGEPEYCNKDETETDFARRMAVILKKLIPQYPGEGPHPGRWSWMTGLFQGEIRSFEGEKDLIIPTRKENRRNID